MRIAVGAVFVAGPADAEQPLALSLWIRGLVDGFGDRLIHRLELSREVFRAGSGNLNIGISGVSA